MSMPRLICVFLLILLVTGSAGTAWGNPVRIAVVSDDNDRDLAALVSTELSGRPDIELLERDDLAKVGDEKKVQQLAGGDAIALGKLVGADGLIFIAKSANGLEVRFTAVGLGYALFDDRLQAGVDLPAQAKAIAHRVADYAPKLKLSPTQAIPISILNLRADFPTPESTLLERQLTLLLESRLSSLPRYVVLERRHAWSIGFERSLAPDSPQLLAGACVVDGTFAPPTPETRDLTIHLRVRAAKGAATDVAIDGTSSDLSTLVEKMAAAIEAVTGTNDVSADWQPQKEAREYLLEGVWGWQHHANTEALEALDSAELLGEKAPQLHAVRVAVLCALAKEGLNIENYSIRLPDQSDPALADQKTALILRAIDETLLARQPGQPADDTPDAALRDAVRYLNPGKLVVDLGTFVLVLLDRDSPADSAQVRDALRKVSGYDPLHGTLGPYYAQDYIGLRDLRANEWPATLDEQLAAYRLICSSQSQFVPSLFFEGGKNFCHRFLLTPEQQAAGFQKFVASLRDIPEARLTYLLVGASSPDPALADASYRAWLAELWAHRDAFAHGGYDPRWSSARELLPDLISRNAVAGLPLLHYALQHRDDYLFNDPFLVLFWHPETWSEAEAAQIWKEFGEYKERVAQKWRVRDSNVEILAGQFEPYEAAFRKYFPALATEQPASVPRSNALIATRFWYPWRSQLVPPNYFMFGTVDHDSQGVWLVGFSPGSDHAFLFRVALPDFTTRIVPVPDNHDPQQVKATPDALFLTWETHGHDGSSAIAHQIARYDLATGQWGIHDLPDYSDCEIYPVGNALYLFLRLFSNPGNEGVIARYDWNSDKLTILSSTRRRPAQNQFDDRPTLNQVQIFAGPGGRPCTATDDGVVYIQDTPGTWPFVFDCSFWDHAITSAGRTLIQNQYGEATLIDPTSDHVEHLMAAYMPFVRSRPVPGQKPVRGPSPWAGQTIWDSPAEHTWYGKMAFGDGHLFILDPPVQKGGAYDLLIYTQGQGRAPRHVPLEFHLSDADRLVLSAKPLHAPVTWEASQIEHPDTTIYPDGDVQLVGTAQGLVIQPANVGFWFIPYGDIDAWLKAPSATAP
jgi:hypothetical protein